MRKLLKNDGIEGGKYGEMIENIRILVVLVEHIGKSEEDMGKSD